MKIDFEEAKKFLVSRDFKKLFFEQLGWDKFDDIFEVMSAAQNFQLKGVAEKRGFACFTCMNPTTSAIRMKIDSEVTKHYREHIIIYIEDNSNSQIWQWVRREPGKPIANRTYTFFNHQSGLSLLQRLEKLAVTYDMEENTTISDITSSIRSAFDSEKVTKKFYDKFTREHESFQKHITGITDKASLEWYTSLTLNRLMFVYFIQKKGFLDNNSDYLKDRLQQFQKYQGNNKFITFYRFFLLHLFHDGLGKSEEQRNLDPYMTKLLGRVPYLNGGYFEKHQLENDNPKIDISDEAFSNIFNFFDQYQWHLDTRPTHDDNEINPDVIGYIFEKYINQKQMGAYYTKEDITGYISKFSILPYLLSKIEKLFPEVFSKDGLLLSLFRNNPDRYINLSLSEGVIDKDGRIIDLPENIKIGLLQLDKREDWNNLAPSPYSLSNETWREYIYRRNRYFRLKDFLLNQNSIDTDDLITNNLDIWQITRDIITFANDCSLVLAIWDLLSELSVLDPTCGSGAFLFSALTILETLYRDCIEKLQFFIESTDCPISELNKEIILKLLALISQHPNEEYFILKSIVINNLFGVDIMEEAVEICKLRLFLKLIAQISNFEQIEPLPDIDFNIRVGNTLIGYSKLSDVIDSQEGTLGFGNEQIEEINIVTKEIDSHFAKFRIGQTHNIYTATLKNEITKLLKNLQHKLNVYLAEEYGIFKSKDDFEILLNSWVTTHRPFHWFVEFFPIMSKGGFCIIIGNPPYVEYSKVKETYSIKNYKTELCGNLYTFVIERSMNLANQNARIGMIVPHSLICTDRMEPIQGILNQKANPVWYSTYDIRPSKLFIGVDQRLCIFLCGLKAEFTKKYSTKYYRWKEEERKTLFSSLEYVDVGNIIYQNSIPKIGNSAYDKVIWDKLNYYSRLKVVYQGEDYKIFYHNAPRYWIRAMNFVPYFWNERDGEQISSQIKSLGFRDKEISEAICSILNSSLFYWWFIVLSDSRHLNKREIDNFPFGIEALEKEDIIKLSILCNLLMEDYKKNAYRKLCQYAKTGRVIYDEFYPKKSKPIIDKIDKLLANHYKLSAEEMDYIINFDYRFRVGDTDDDSED